jgi:hypothetical protein
MLCLPVFSPSHDTITDVEDGVKTIGVHEFSLLTLSSTRDSIVSVDLHDVSNTTPSRMLFSSLTSAVHILNESFCDLIKNNRSLSQKLFFSPFTLLDKGIEKSVKKGKGNHHCMNLY